MAGRGSLFVRNFSIGNTFDNMFLEGFIFSEQEKVGSEEEGSEYLYIVPFKEVDHLQRHKIYYMKKVGGLKEIPALPTRHLLILKI